MSPFVTCSDRWVSVHGDWLSFGNRCMPLDVQKKVNMVQGQQDSPLNCSWRHCHRCHCHYPMSLLFSWHIIIVCYWAHTLLLEVAFRWDPVVQCNPQRNICMPWGLLYYLRCSRLNTLVHLSPSLKYTVKYTGKTPLIWSPEKHATFPQITPQEIINFITCIHFGITWGSEWFKYKL